MASDKVRSQSFLKQGKMLWWQVLLKKRYWHASWTWSFSIGVEAWRTDDSLFQKSRTRNCSGLEG